VLPLETYLCSVVPSEMPASYHEEALKAQAILARTYAYKYLIEPAYPELNAHVDDSITFQVYGNIEHNINATNAVRDTKGTLLFSDRSLAEVYYYSTSCGYGTDGTAWGGEGRDYLKGVRIGAGELQNADGTMRGEDAEQYYLSLLKEEQFFQNMLEKPFVEGYESSEPWYRWQALDLSVSPQVILERLKERYNVNPNVVLIRTKDGRFVSKAVKKLGEIKSIRIDERGNGGCCKSLIIEGSENTYKVLLEYNIRYVLNGAGTTVTRADGSEIYCKTLLPSGFFFLDTVQDGKNVISYSIYGGGYGHGVGMSQNGANRMAAAGFSCNEILQKFFPGTILVSYGD
jgi:stage II sporulation protein D